MTQEAPTGGHSLSPHAPAILHLVRPAASRTARPFSPGARTVFHGSDAGVLACLATMARTPWCEHKVIVFGGGDAGRRAAALGLRADGRIAPPLGRVELAAPALRRWLAAHGEPRVVQGWGGEFAGLRSRIAGLSRLSRGAAWCVADMDTGVFESRSGHWPPAMSVMTAWLRPAGPVGPRPAGAGGLPRVLLLGDPPAAVDALTFAYALGILNVGRMGTAAVVPRGAARLDRTVRHVRSGGYVRRLEVVDDPPLARPDAFDLAMCVPADGDDGPQEPSFGTKIAVRAALDAGLPVIVPDSAWSREVMPRGAHGCIAPSLESSRLARIAWRLLAEGGLDEARSALLATKAPAARDIVKDVVEAWGLNPPEAIRGASISEPKSAPAPAGSA